MNRWHLLALVLLVGAAHSGLHLAVGSPLDAALFARASAAAAIVGACVFAFDRWLWRLPLLHPWFVPAPNLNGDWEVAGAMSFLRAKTAGEYAGVALVRQNFFSISIDIDWGSEGRTRFLMRSPLAAHSDGFVAFSGIYEYAPPSGSAYPVQVHRAGFYLHSPERRPSTVVIHYSTISEQVGVLTLKRRK